MSFGLSMGDLIAVYQPAQDIYRGYFEPLRQELVNFQNTMRKLGDELDFITKDFRNGDEGLAVRLTDFQPTLDVCHNLVEDIRRASNEHSMSQEISGESIREWRRRIMDCTLELEKMVEYHARLRDAVEHSNNQGIMEACSNAPHNGPDDKQSKNEVALGVIFENPTTPPIRPHSIRSRYTKILDILLCGNRGNYIPYFKHHDSLPDKKFPFNQPPDHFSLVITAPSFLKDFQEQQWRFRALRLNFGRSKFWQPARVLGSFEQGDKHNIILEYANKGTLEDYFKRESPPSTAQAIYCYWGALLMLGEALTAIHSQTINGRVYHGWHQDVKPQNILVSTRKGKLEFKLADLGLSHFQLQGGADAYGCDTRGTRTYSAPECYRHKSNRTSGILQVTPKVDIWSLGCVLSEAAMWLVHGWVGLQEYHYFHNGEDTLPCVTDNLSPQHLLENGRRNDTLTGAVLSIIADILVPADYRAEAKQIWHKSQRALKSCKYTLEGPALATISQSPVHPSSPLYQNSAFRTEALFRPGNFPRRVLTSPSDHELSGITANPMPSQSFYDLENRGVTPYHGTKHQPPTCIPHPYDIWSLGCVLLEIGALLTTGSASALVINGYHGSLPSGNSSPLWAEDENRSLIIQLLTKILLKLSMTESIPLPRFITAPTPGEFIAASLVYGLATTTFYYSQRRRQRHCQHQKRLDHSCSSSHEHYVLLAGIISPSALGHFLGLDTRGAVMQLMPWTILVALIIGATLHRLLSLAEQIGLRGKLGNAKVTDIESSLGMDDGAARAKGGI